MAAAWRGTAARHSTREGEPSTEVVGNHPAARVIASLRRSAAIVVSCHPLAAATLPTVSSAGFSYRFLPFSSLSLLALSLSRSHGLRSSLGLIRFGPLAAPRCTSHSVSFSYYRSDLASSAATTAAVAARVSNRGRRGCLSYTGIRNTVIPLSLHPLAASPHHPASHRLQHPMHPPFCSTPAPCRRLRHRRGRV